MRGAPAPGRVSAACHCVSTGAPAWWWEGIEHGAALAHQPVPALVKQLPEQPKNPRQGARKGLEGGQRPRWGWHLAALEAPWPHVRIASPSASAHGRTLGWCHAEARGSTRVLFLQAASFRATHGACTGLFSETPSRSASPSNFAFNCASNLPGLSPR